MALHASAMFEPSGYDFFEPSNFTYRAMQDSGEFRGEIAPEEARELLATIKARIRST